jgi:hypothetical protein
MRALLNSSLCEAWGGEPPKAVEGYWRYSFYPSTMLRMVPLPTSFARREELA